MLCFTRRLSLSTRSLLTTPIKLQQKNYSTQLSPPRKFQQRTYSTQLPKHKAIMSVSLYDITVPVFLKHLNTLSVLLEKGVEHAKDGGNEKTEEGLLGARLIADMEGFIYQIQRVSDTSKALAVRIGKVAPVAIADIEKTFPELQQRIKTTIEILESVKKPDLDASASSEVILKTHKGDLKFTGVSYALNFAIPNFYFHFVTAYALLRKEGVQIGKADYLVNDGFLSAE